MRSWIIVPLLLLGPALSHLAGQSLQAVHDHDPWGECHGTITVSDSGVDFESDKPEHSRHWKWIDIQSFDRLSERRFSVLTWEDQSWKLGLDRSFDFHVEAGQPPLTTEIFNRITSHLKGPVTDRQAASIEAEYSVPVKHLHTFGGCEGTLRFSSDWIVFESDNKRDTRTWRRDRDVESFWSPDPYHLEIHTYEENQKEFDKTRRFRFQLKAPLDRTYYGRLRRQMPPPF